jgi:hypothetical protein
MGRFGGNKHFGCVEKHLCWSRIDPTLSGLILANPGLIPAIPGPILPLSRTLFRQFLSPKSMSFVRESYLTLGFFADNYLEKC